MREPKITLSARYGTWHLRWYAEDGVRKSKVLGTVREWPTRAEAVRANRSLLTVYKKDTREAPSVAELVAAWESEDMPARESTRRSYGSYLRNHVLPEWGARRVAEWRPD